MPRPTKLTPAVQETLVDAIRRGASYAIAARQAGIHWTTFQKWRDTGVKASRGAKHELMMAIERAEAEAALAKLDRIELAGSEHWQADAWWLERRFPQDYGKQVIEHTTDEAHPFKVIFERVSAGQKPEPEEPAE